MAFADALRTEVNTALKRAGGAMSLLLVNRPTHFVQANESFIEFPDWVVLEENPEVSEQYPLASTALCTSGAGRDYRRGDDDTNIGFGNWPNA